MSILLGTELWDRHDAIIAFNENNTVIFDKIQKVLGDYCKSQLVNTLAQKRLIERFLTENDAIKNSEFSFSSNAYFLTQQVLNIVNVHETFSNAFLNEIEEVVRCKCLNIKKDSRLMKTDNKILSDDLLKENLKLENSLKRYKTTFNVKETAYNAFIKAEENKALSRNQVDNYNTFYKQKKSQYDDAKNDYLATLTNYNNYQSRHYTTLLQEWGSRAQTIEQERYTTMRATFTTVSELCKSMASKFNEIANEIESRMETIECEQDCTTLINKEKTSDVPPRDVPFKDFDVQEKVEVEESRDSKGSNCGSDSTSSNSVNRKSSLTDINKSITTIQRGSLGNINKTNTLVSNGVTSGGFKFIGKLFGGPKKSKEIIVPPENIQSEIEEMQPNPDEKCLTTEECEVTVQFTQDPESIKETDECLKNVDPEERKSNTTESLGTLEESTVKMLSRKNSVDENHTGSNMSLFIKRSRGSFRNFLDKRRSRSLSGLVVVDPDAVTNEEQKPAVMSKKPKPTTELKPTKPKPCQKPKIRDQPTSGNNRESIRSRTIEVIRAVGQVEIVSTPAEALASAARASELYAADQETYADITSECYSTSTNSNQVYDYYYVGSCVAIHEYKSTDPSNIYLSFDIGEQFYIIKEDEVNESSGWLLVERIDRSQSGYVPASYMDTRKFDDPVLMQSDHSMVMV